MAVKSHGASGFQRLAELAVAISITRRRFRLQWRIRLGGKAMAGRLAIHPCGKPQGVLAKAR